VALRIADSGSYPFPYQPFHLGSQKKGLLNFEAFVRTLCEDVSTWVGQQEGQLSGRVIVFRGCLPLAENDRKNVGIQSVMSVVVRALQNDDQSEDTLVCESVRSSILWPVRYYWKE
jgi:hypothetical protein